MIRVFLDANILFVAAASPEGGSALLVRLCQKGRLEAVVSHLVLLEAERNIRKKLPALALHRFHQMLETAVFRVTPAPPQDQVRIYQDIVNPKDAPILAAAVLSRSIYLVTLDRRGFMTQKIRKARFPIRIVTPKELFSTIKLDG